VGESSEEFTRYRKCDGSEFVKFGDGSKAKIVGKGDIKLKCGLKLRNVLHVPKLKIDLVSVGKLDQHGMTTVFHNGGSIRSGRKTMCSLTYLIMDCIGLAKGRIRNSFVSDVP
jgi:hypothetical protein